MTCNLHVMLAEVNYVHVLTLAKLLRVKNSQTPPHKSNRKRASSLLLSQRTCRYKLFCFTVQINKYKNQTFKSRGPFFGLCILVSWSWFMYSFG